jgi:hypothetical protein
MNDKSLAKAKAEARRFLDAVKDMEAAGVRRKAQDDDYRRRIGAVPFTSPALNFAIGTKESAALRRISMDLTRALAEMRKP